MSILKRCNAVLRKKMRKVLESLSQEHISLNLTLTSDKILWNISKKIFIAYELRHTNTFNLFFFFFFFFFFLPNPTLTGFYSHG